MFAANSDGNIYFQTGIAGNWEGFEELFPGNFGQNPTLGGGGTEDFYLFVVGEDGHLYYASGYGGLWPQLKAVINPFPLNISLTGSPSVVTGAPNQFDVFATGMDGNLYHFWQENFVTSQTSYRAQRRRAGSHPMKRQQ